MPRRTLIALLTALMVLGLMPTAIADPEPGAKAESFERIPLDGVDARLMPALATPNRLLTVMVQMEGAPVAVREARAQRRSTTLTESSERAIRQNLRAQQRRIADDIVALGGDVLAIVQDAYNGIKVQVRAKRLERLAELPGVRAVRGLQTFEPNNATSVPFIGAPGVWEDLGLTGQDVKVGIIDTGIDYTHADFGGPGTVEAYESNDPEVVEDDTFPTAKVAGGHDFVGDGYDASSENPAENTQPDPDPLDCNGHGTHVAGTAAGKGVLADGSAYDGPYDRSAYTNEFNVGPGVAPEATLYALKVFGCAGSTDVTVEAIDWAVEHDLDVINMSLGSPFGRADDPTAVATNNAAAAGVIVVASAGNSGAGSYITGSPASATRAISVAAMNSIETIDLADVTIEGQGTETLQNSNGADVSEPITGTIRVLQDDPATPDIDEALGCEESDYDIVAPGDIVVTFRGICPRIDRAVLGQVAGAVAVVFINNEPGPPPVEGIIPGVDIPFLGGTPEQTDFFISGDGEQGTITDGGTRPNPEFRTLAPFTSAGPRNGDSFPKPDVTAPGVAISSAFVGSGEGSFRLSGTSMAAPHVAGVAALHREARPDWSVEEAKAALVNTADPGAILDYATVRAGSGLVDPADAVRTPVVATTEPGSASVAFGYLQFDEPISRSRTVTLHNKSDEAVTYTTSAEASTDAGGAAQVSVRPSRVTVPANGTSTVRVRLQADPVVQPPDFQTVSGNVLFEPIVPVFGGADASDLRVSYVAVTDPTSAVQTRPLNVNVKDGQDAVDFRTRNASDVTGTADVYAWGLRDPNEDSPTTDVRAVGVQAFPAVGEDSALGVFAFNTYSPVSSPSVNEWDVLVDTDEDGSFDWAVVGIDLGPFFGLDGRLGSLTVDLATGEIVDAFFAGGGLNTSHVLLPFLPDTLGLDMENADFSYISGVFSFEGFPDDIVDGRSAFNVVDQPVETGQFFTLAGGERMEWSAGVDQEQLAETPVLGWMVVNANNRSGRPQADLVRIRP